VFSDLRVLRQSVYTCTNTHGYQIWDLTDSGTRAVAVKELPLQRVKMAQQLICGITAIFVVFANYLVSRFKCFVIKLYCCFLNDKDDIDFRTNTCALLNAKNRGALRHNKRFGVLRLVAMIQNIRKVKMLAQGRVPVLDDGKTGQHRGKTTDPLFCVGSVLVSSPLLLFSDMMVGPCGLFAPPLLHCDWTIG